MKLYHCANSRSLRVLWALEEMELAYELETLPFPPRVFARHFKAVNPLGTVPALVDGPVTLTESAGACQYLAEKYGPTPLAVGVEEPAFGDYVNWMFRSDATLTFPLTIAFRYTALEPEDRRLPQAADDYRKWFLGRWRSVQDCLSDGRSYLCADRFTMADITVGFAYMFSQILQVEEAKTPEVEAWWARLSGRAGFRRAAAAGQAA